MITTFAMPYRDGELRIGWASWDDGAFKSRSIKYAYKDASGKISRGSPEVPLDVLVDMLTLAAEKGELQLGDSVISRKNKPVTAMKAAELREEKRVLSATLICLQKLMEGVPWADWQQVYDEIGAQLRKVRAELDRRR